MSECSSSINNSAETAAWHNNSKNKIKKSCVQEEMLFEI